MPSSSEMAEKNVAISKAAFAAEIAALSIATIAQIVVFITSGLAGAGDPQKYGFKNNTGVISDIFYTQVCKTIPKCCLCL